MMFGFLEILSPCISKKMVLNLWSFSNNSGEGAIKPPLERAKIQGASFLSKTNFLQVFEPNSGYFVLNACAMYPATYLNPSSSQSNFDREEEDEPEP